MIEVGLEFEDSIERVMATFASLPAPLRPTHFSHKETISRDADCIDDQKRFSVFLAKSKSGFFLLGSQVTYSIRVALGKPLVCDCFIDVAPVLAKQFLEHMSKAKPCFGFACAPSEREHRNRVTAQQGANTIESWVGRNTQKYVPGFYWLTLLPDALAEQHGIPLSSVEQVAHEHVELEGGQHLFRFYERPEDWQTTNAVVDLCASLPGVFNIEKIRSRLSGVESFLELNSKLQEWK